MHGGGVKIFFDPQDLARCNRGNEQKRRFDHAIIGVALKRGLLDERSEEHTSELQSLMRISYAVFCLKKKKTKKQKKTSQTLESRHRMRNNTTMTTCTRSSHNQQQ